MDVWFVIKDVNYQFILNEIIKTSLIFVSDSPLLSLNMLNYLMDHVRELENAVAKKPKLN